MNTTKETKEYIEPVGFAGTKGEWVNSESFKKIHTAGSILHLTNICEMQGNYGTLEVRSNAILLSQSKEMLKLLQWITKATNSPEIGIRCDKMINKALNINQ